MKGKFSNVIQKNIVIIDEEIVCIEKSGYNTQEIIIWTKKSLKENLMKIERDPIIEIEEMEANSIGEMREDPNEEAIENMIEEMSVISIEERIAISINDREARKISGLGQSSAVNVEPVNSGSSQELESTAVITRIYPSKL